ncbi:AraC family transcriptional regulator [Paracraurococcus lichenis]|uniref:AraC family transcriptional regulator n=1 Tax=Paracraurococcus lichenis TaxID=3064888 RepID=A0ABT9E4U8_9PROT|nr:AraC family transcriptional regulator [Paracraurococcus sp. LOR1-02]MDO9711173.1 AraC family transcriptional regulator [Paracraurococcus sp. LOR1-02]
MPGERRIRLHRDPATGIETIEAFFPGHAYDPHRHEDWLVGVTHHGVQAFRCRGRRWRSTPGRVILLEPEEVHDGEADDAAGFAYGMLYLPQPWLRAQLGPGPAGDPGFRTTLVEDPRLAQAIRRALRSQAAPEGRLAHDAALDAVVEALRPQLGRPQREPARGDAALARRARAVLHDLMTEEIGADALARAAGAADRFRLARAFRAAYGLSPHAYLVQIRLVEARRRLARGGRPAAVAAELGFADQSHLGRWFRRAYGLTPAAYAARCTGVPDGARAAG